MRGRRSQFRGCDDSTLIETRIGRYGVALRSALPQIAAEFDTMYPCDPAGMDSSDFVIRLEVERDGRSRFGSRRYRVCADGVVVGQRLGRKEVLPFLEWGINLRVIMRCKRFVQLHAASLCYRGQGVVFAGQSGCGKSTLAAALMSRGWHYLCDEFALVEPSTMTLHPFPKAACIKSGSFDLMRRMGVTLMRNGTYIKARKGPVAYVSPHSFGPETIGIPVPVRYVVFPQYEPRTRPTLRPISKGKALLDLTACVFNRHKCSHDVTAVLAALLRGAQPYVLETAGLEDTCDLLEAELCGKEEAANLIVPQSRSLGAIADRTGKQKQGEMWHRRDVLRLSGKLVYVAPVVTMLSAQDAIAAASTPSGVCSTGVETGGACATDDDCCSAQCSFGVCQ